MNKLLLSASLAALALASPALAEPFSKVEQKVYLKECIGDDATMKAYCECTLNELQKRMTVAEYHALAELSEEALMNNDKFSDSIVACSEHIE